LIDQKNFLDKEE
jgi:rRNA biogenesis protein RRP5